MPSDERKPMSWKQPTGSSGPPPSHRRDWQPTRPKQGAPRSRSRSLFVPALVGAFLVSAIVAAVLLFRPARLPVLVLVTPGDAGTFAIWPNVAGANAGKLLAAWASEGGDRPRLLRPPADVVKPDDWAAGLDDAPEDGVVVYFSLHGGVDAEGEPFLWLVPPDARLPRPEHRLKIRSILSRLAQLPEQKRKLVILDATQQQVGYSQGQIHNDFARALKKLDPQIEQIPNLVVWCSSDEDQRSWVSEEWQVSIFAHLLVEGLRGAAGTDRVTVEALHEYLRRELPAWTQSRRGEAQSPLLLPMRTGVDRARRIELSLVSARRYSPPDPAAAPGATLSVAEDLARAWQRRDALAAAVPPPQTLAPHRWRRYLDSLLRIELMARHGLPAAEVTERLAQLAREEPLLTRLPWPELTSTASSLAMPAALGLRPSRPSEPRPIQALLADPIQEWPRWREAAVARGGESELFRLRHGVAAAILDEVIREHRPGLFIQAAKSLEIVYGSEAAPVEVHWLRLLARDLDSSPRPPDALIRESLKVQILAEQTALLGAVGIDEYPETEHVLTWVGPSLSAADADRLSGFDHLLSADAKDWDRAAQLLANAAEKYQAIAKMAARVRQALSTRNTIFAELPYFGRWVAGLPSDLDAADRRRWLEAVEAVAEVSHRLDSLLGDPAPNRLDELGGLAQTAQQKMDELRNAFFGYVARLNGEVLISRWHQIDNALQVPFIPAKRRRELLDHLKHISSSLSIGGKEIDPSAIRPSGDAREVAERHGRVSLALLGSRWIDGMRQMSDGNERLPRFEELQQMLRAPKSEWWQTMTEVGDRLGQAWRGLAERVESLHGKALAEPLASARLKFALADSLARRTDSAATFPLEIDPTSEDRRRRWHDVMLFQAKRTIEANWGALEPSERKSFADVLVERFVADARSLVLLGAGSNPSPEDVARLFVEVKAFEAKLPVARPTLSPIEPSRDLTEQQRNVRLRFAVHRPAGEGAGLPAIRFESSGPVRVSTTAESRRLVREFAPGPPAPESVESPLDVELDLKAASGSTGRVTAQLWYRGHRLTATSQLLLNREPSSVWVYHPRRGPASFAVRAAPDVRAGAVAIVLDWSRSMKAVGPNGKSRYDQALGALETVLASLPPETVVSIRQFGTPGGNSQPLRLSARPYDFQSNPGQLAELIRQLGRNQPDGINTPLARAIVDAIDDLPPGGERYRTIVALSDGEDNVDQGQAGTVVARALARGGIELRLVVFQASDAEMANIRSQFEEIERLDPPGRLYAAADQQALAASLTDAMRPRVRVFSKDEVALRPVHDGGRGGIPVTLHGSNLEEWWRPGLPPASYQLRSQTAVGDILLSPGDRLLVELARADGRLRFRNRLYVTQAVPRDGRQLLARSNDGQNVHVALANARLIRSETDERQYDFEAMLLAERERQGDEIRVTYPKFVWAEVATQNDNAASALRARFENVLHFPAPAFQIRVWNWPALPGQSNVRQSPSRPNLTLWWRDTMPRDPHLIRRDPRKTLAENFVGRTFTVDGKQVTIEEARFENNELLMQLSHPPGEPVVFLRPEELHDLPALTLGEEHRFYTKSGKYTVRFGPLSDEEQKRAFTLQIFSMAELKKDASKIDLRPQIAPDTSDLLGQDTPRPVRID